jgi:endo-1,4-beta-mannosidase
MSNPFLLGVNYWPRRKAMYWWSQFDAGEVDEDFALISALGLKVVRLFLLWDDFQSEPSAVDRAALAHLTKTADIAVKHNLQLDVTFFTGHMSGPNWAPRWMLTQSESFPSPYFAWVRQVISQGAVVPQGNYLNMFKDPVALEAERVLLRAVVGALKDHPAIYLWNLGNEPDLFAVPEHEVQGQAWTREMMGVIREMDPVHPVTVGLHCAELYGNTGLRIDQVFAETSVAVMHAYPMYCDWAHGPLDPNFVPFMTALTAALCGKPVLMEEFGGCTSLRGHDSETWKWMGYGTERTQFMASEEAFAEYIRQVLPNLHAVGATGAFIWCFADYAPELWNLPPCRDSWHERHFGLVRPDGSLKPHAEVIKQFAALQPEAKPIPEYARFPEVTGTRFYEQRLFESLPQMYQQYLERLLGDA